MERKSVFQRLIGLRRMEFSAVAALNLTTDSEERQTVYDRVRAVSGTDFLSVWRMSEDDTCAALELADELEVSP